MEQDRKPRDKSTFTTREGSWQTPDQFFPITFYRGKMYIALPSHAFWSARRGIKHTQTAVQPSPPSVPELSSSCKTETLCPSLSDLHPPLLPGSLHPALCLCGSAPREVSHGGNHTQSLCDCPASFSMMSPRCPSHCSWMDTAHCGHSFSVQPERRSPVCTQHAFLPVQQSANTWAASMF